MTIKKKKGRRCAAYWKWRKAVMTRDHYKCRWCDETNKSLLQAHHLLGWTKWPDLRFELDNGLTLCHSCHKKWHEGDKDEKEKKP
jgi:hypothetical protein